MLQEEFFHICLLGCWVSTSHRVILQNYNIITFQVREPPNVLTIMPRLMGCSGGSDWQLAAPVSPERWDMVWISTGTLRQRWCMPGQQKCPGLWTSRYSVSCLTGWEQGPPCLCLVEVLQAALCLHIFIIVISIQYFYLFNPLGGMTSPRHQGIWSGICRSCGPQGDSSQAGVGISILSNFKGGGVPGGAN